jgi:hypothetical protein
MHHSLAGQRGLVTSNRGHFGSLTANVSRALRDSPRIRTLQNLEARGGIEPPIKVLQTFALPLGDRASAGSSWSLPKLILERILPEFRCAGVVTNTRK